MPIVELCHPKSNASLANNLAIELGPSGRPLIYIKNNKGPKINSHGTPALIGSQLDSWAFNNIL